jgi:hypothetical protein
MMSKKKKMEFNYSLFGLLISYGVSFTLLYTRHMSWSTEILRWSICFALCIVGAIGLSSELAMENKRFFLFSWCLITPVICNLLDRFFKKLSESISRRDFYLWLRGSWEIDDSFTGKNPHVNNWDKLFSILLLIVILVLPVLGVR